MRILSVIAAMGCYQEGVTNQRSEPLIFTSTASHLSQNRNIRFTHLAYEPPESLLSDLSGILLVDRHWREQFEKRNHVEYDPEAFQRLVLQFILAHRDDEKT